MKRLKPTEFTALKKKWALKLKQSKFRDIENSKGDLIDHQTVFDFSQRIGFRSGTWEDIRDYYIWAEHMLIDGRFKSDRDRRIWRRHADGDSSREIAAHIELEQTWICRKIRKIRKYLCEQCKDERSAA